MKICPNCQREFPDTMRFCQTDGTPLPDAVEPAPPDDPLKTTVVRQDEIAAMIPPDDPFKTMIASRVEAVDETEDEEDVLQLPQDFDPMATMVVSPISVPEKPATNEPVPDPPAPASVSASEESQPEASAVSTDAPIAAPLSEPPPPVFSEPVVEAPSFSNSTPSSSFDDDLPATLFQSQFDEIRAPAMPSEPVGESPISSPPPSFEPPASVSVPPPASVPVPPPVSEPLPPPVSEPLPPPAEQFRQSPFETPQADPAPAFTPTPFDVPASPFNAPSSPFAPEPAANQAFQPAEWNPPPASVGEWGSQAMGANTPFQPPVAAGQSKTLAIVSLITGLLGFVSSFGSIIPLLALACFPASFLFGIAGIITGFLARGRAKKEPEQYGGAGLALGGIILGVLGILVIVGLIVLVFALGMAGALMK